MNRHVAVPLRKQALAFARLHQGQPTTPFVGNLQAEVHMVETGDLSMPVTCSSSMRDNAWVVSPATTYGSYAAEESDRLAPSWTRPSLRSVIAWASREMHATGLDRAVSVNNWLVSTNIYPELEQQMVGALRDECIERWPTQSIWLRSLNWTQHGAWLKALIAAGFHLIPTRQVYLFHGLEANRRSNLRHDLELTRKTTLQPVENRDFLHADYARSERLYAQLYLEKYSSLNPAYSAEFLRSWHESGLLCMSGWRDGDGSLQGVVGMFSQGPVSTAPIVGYNTQLPQSLGLYRLLMAQVFQRAMETQGVLNLSAGAGGFKRLRGGVPAIEYSAVHARHLPARTRRFLRMLQAVTSGIGAPIMKWMKL